MLGCADALMNRECSVSRKKNVRNCSKKISKQRGKLPNIEQLKKAYDTFDQKLFVSCWFNFVDLADVVLRFMKKTTLVLLLARVLTG